MSAARERAFGEGSELEEVERQVPEEVPAKEEEKVPASHGRFGRIALLVAVVGVEGVWLALLAYGAWQLIGLIP
jgi:hypothetical protein